jgi:hypothetical protein
MRKHAKNTRPQKLLNIPSKYTKFRTRTVQAHIMKRKFKIFHIAVVWQRLPSLFSLFPSSPALPRSASPLSSLFIPYNFPIACLARDYPACKPALKKPKTKHKASAEESGKFIRLVALL